MSSCGEGLRLAAWRLLLGYIELADERCQDPERHQVVIDMRHELGDVSDLEEAVKRAEFMAAVERLEKQHGFVLVAEEGGRLEAVPRRPTEGEVSH